MLDLYMVDKSYLIAIGEFRTAVAVSPHLSGQIHLVYLGKVNFLKKCWLIGQAKNGANTELIKFTQASFDQLSANALFLVTIGYRQ